MRNLKLEKMVRVAANEKIIAESEVPLHRFKDQVRSPSRLFWRSFTLSPSGYPPSMEGSAESDLTVS